MLTTKDREARKKLIRLAKDFVLGRISNDELEDGFDELYDLGNKNLYPLFMNGLWTLYSDDREYKLIGKNAPSPETKRYVARIILFLQSDLEFRWPLLKLTEGYSMAFYALTFILITAIALYTQSWVGYLLLAITGVVTLHDIKQKKADEKQENELEAKGADFSVWPFYNQEDYQSALAHPIYFSGR